MYRVLHEEYLANEETCVCRHSRQIRALLSPSSADGTHDAGVRYIREILVYARHDAHDDLVVDTAEHLSKVHDARLTFVEYIPDSAGENVVSSESDYLEQIRAACNAPSEAIIVRGSNEVAAIGQASAAYDLLVMADSQERSLLTAIRGSHADRVTEVARCSVLRLQSPHRRPDR